MRVFKRILLGLLIVFVLLQFIPGSVNKNKQVLSTDITRKYKIPDGVQSILKKACYDCHSNNTRYPWYAFIQPFRLILDDHVKNGKKDLNFSEFTVYSEKRQYNKLRAIEESLEKGTMPLNSYNMVHPEARLAKEEKDSVIKWVNDTRNLIRPQKTNKYIKK